jgi:hypothetical protein
VISARDMTRGELRANEQKELKQLPKFESEGGRSISMSVWLWVLLLAMRQK